MSDSPAPKHHLLAIRVENKAGVLVRIAGLFARRGFNIVSLAVAPTNDVHFSRVSIVVDAESAPLRQIVDQLDKLINVVEITELNPMEAQQAELLLVTLKTDKKVAKKLTKLVAASKGTVLSTSKEAMTVMLAGPPETLDDFETSLRNFEILELQRSGSIALPKLKSAS
jgi:acetolactate synthase-1/3 small subunit